MIDKVARDSGDEAADTVWNNAHSGMKTVTVSQLSGTAKFFCTMSPVANYGEFYPDVENGKLVMKHTQGAANDTFSIVDGVLKASNNIYSFDYPNVKVESNTIACTLTSSMFVYTAVPTQGYRFTYNSDGLRVKKESIKGGLVIESTDYTLHGKLVTEMRKGQDVLHFFYDAQGRVSMVEWNGEKYGYVHNLQGDIAAIVDSSGAKVVEYRYDAWGRDIGRTLTSDIGELNPFRYRGYVYDEETELYYLRTRYYNAIIGKFTCLDDCIPGALLEENVFSYAKNNPILNGDPDGTTSYTVVLNVYYPENYGNKEGHYDISIISKETGQETIMSYGPDSDNNGIITSYQYGRGTNQIPNERFLIFDDVSEDDIDRFYSNYYEKYATVTDEEGPVYGSSIDRVIYEDSKTYRKKKSSKKTT